MVKKIHPEMGGCFLDVYSVMTNFRAKATNSIAQRTNSIAKWTNSIAKVTNSFANGMNSIAKATNSIAKICNILFILLLMQSIKHTDNYYWNHIRPVS